MKYSVIIPVYNSEKCLNRCVDSLLSQKFSDYEIILVNDGSTDDSLKLCEGYSKKYENIKTINKENNGASSARNAGLDVAKGDFILFVDSDDYVKSDYFEKLSTLDCKERLIVFTYSFVKETGETIRKIPKELTDAGADFFSKTKFLVLSRTINSPCAKIFDRNIIEKYCLRFDERMPVAEDFNFCLAYLMKCNDAEIHNSSIYCYDVTDKNSLTRSKKEGLIDIYPIVFDEAYKTIKASPFTVEQKQELYCIWDKLHVDSFGTCVMEELKETERPTKETKKVIKELCKKFYSEYPGGYGYQNAVHRIMRLCIKHSFGTALYILGKQYMRMRG